MSIYGTNQVEEVIIGAAVATEGTVADFKSSASDKEIAVLAVDGGAAAEGKEFKLYQKNGQTASGLGYEFSDTVNPKKIEKITLKEYAPEVQKEVTVTGFDGNVKANTLYAVNVRLYNESGALSVENFRVISGYYQTPADVTGITAADIRDAIAEGLANEIKSRGDSEFVIATSNAPTALTITGKYQDVKAGRDIGAGIEFDVTTKALDNDGFNQGLLSAATTQAYYPGNGTGKQVVNKEWFAAGFKYSPYREMAYPSNFDTPYYAEKGGKYNTIIISYKTNRISPTVEEQHRSLLIYIAKPTDDNPGNVPTNDVLADLRAFVDDALVPADLAAV